VDVGGAAAVPGRAAGEDGCASRGARGGRDFLALEVAAKARNDHLTLAPVDLLRVVRWVQEKKAYTTSV
jgi:hypothetical protein